MFDSLDAFEIRMELKGSMDRIEEMLKEALPEFVVTRDSIAEYSKNKLEKVGCSELASSEVRTKEEWDMIREFAKKDRISAMFHALLIGFSNGVEWERKKSEIYN